MGETTTGEASEDASALIATPDAWLHKDAAETADGRQVGHFHPEAVRSCLASASTAPTHREGEEAVLSKMAPGRRARPAEGSGDGERRQVGDTPHARRGPRAARQGRR